MRFLVALSLVLLCSPAIAATRYVVTVEEGPGTEHGARRSYLIEGEQWRIDVVDEGIEPRFWDTLIGRSEGVIGLDHQRRAWFPLDAIRRDDARQIIPGLRDWSVPMSKLNVAAGMTSDVRDPVPAGEIAGRDALMREFRLRTTVRGSIQGTRVDAQVSATIRLWTIDGVPEVPAELDLRRIYTGVPNLEVWLQSELTKIEGFVAKREVLVVRKLDMGQATSSRSVVSVADIDPDAVAPAAAFEIPAGYTEAPPQVSGPGL